MSDREREANEPETDVVETMEADGETDEPRDEHEVELENLRAELAEQNDRLLRTVAEMDNLRKRTRREVVDARRFAQADLLRPMLEILDNFDRALSAEVAGAGDDDAFRAGVELIAQSFRQALRERGVEAIAADGAEFDPAVHEAVGQQPAPEGTESGTVLAVVQEGYTQGDLVLRPSRVIVAQ